MNTSERCARVCILTSFLLPLWAGCLPPELEKYREKSGAKHTESLAIDPLSTVGSRADMETGQAAQGKQVLERAPRNTLVSGKVSGTHGEVAGIYAIDNQTFKVVARDEEVWDAVLDVLLKHYTLTIVDRQSGIVSTEWDTFMRSSTAYRNKLSLRVHKSGRTSVNLTIHNSVERLRGANEGGGALGAVWLPSEDPSQETRRIVQNIAILLDMPPPVVPPEGAVASKEVSVKSM